MILLALDLAKYPDLFFAGAVSHAVAWVLFVAGAVGVYALGLLVLPRVYGGSGVDIANANFAWYIPPVSHLIIPVAGLELAVVMPEHRETAFLLSMVSLGVGLFLFLLVGATVYQRYVVAAPPAPGIAATSFIGVAPPAILAVILFKLIGLADAGTVAGLDPSAVRAFAIPGILATWGFAMWAFVVAVMVVWGQARRDRLPFALSWWAFVFPTGALAVAAGVAWKATGYGSIQWIHTGVTVTMLGMWAVVAVRTVAAVRSGRIFVPTH